jgi:hypothetical protein
MERTGCWPEEEEDVSSWIYYGLNIGHLTLPEL